MKFRDIIGQSEVIGQVRDAITHGRLPHALMITGPEGTGKLALAQAITQYVNCLQPAEGDSCGRCSNCLKIQKGIHPDIRYVLPIVSKTEGGRRFLTEDYFQGFREQFFENPYFSFSQWQQLLDGDNKQLFISVHEIRELKRNLNLKAFEAPYKVVIVWHADKINVEGANAFLKLLEEPPDKTLIIMTCSDVSQLLPTINSRCQRLRLHRVIPDAIRDYLITRHQLIPEMAASMAAIAEGSPGQASLYLSENTQSLSAQYMEWMRAAYSGNYQKISAEVEKLQTESKEYQKLFLQTAIRKLRDAFLYHVGLPQLALATEEERGFQEKFSAFVSQDKVDKAVAELEDCIRQLSGNANSQMVFTALSLRLYGIMRAS
ncbi:MAG: DNA polymerase III subunit delta' [Bacteroidia bacterium]|nr:DNA polymerase III subunit delta' [Bacteroidia bacterium]